MFMGAFYVYVHAVWVLGIVVRNMKILEPIAIPIDSTHLSLLLTSADPHAHAHTHKILVSSK